MVKEDINEKNEFLFEEIKEDPINDEGHITEPFDPNQIDIDTKEPTISNIVDKIQNNEIDLSPDFQRKQNLWTDDKQSRLIESILLRIPLPMFYFDVEVKKDSAGFSVNTWHVVDGLQRLCTIRNFMLSNPKNGSTLKLKGLEFLSHLDGKSFTDLPGPYQRVIQQTQLMVCLIKAGTPENVKFNIFKRVNTGGLPLNQQEIRHALNQGAPANFLEELANSDHFKTATKNKIDSERMNDREYVNRFLAFFLLDRDSYQDLDSFLNRALQFILGKSEEERNKIKEIFFDTLDTIFHCFGVYSFCKLDKYPKVKPINKVLFEVITVSVAKLTEEERKTLRTRDCLKQYTGLFTDSSDNGLVSLVSKWTSEKNRVSKRYEIIENFLKEVIHA